MTKDEALKLALEALMYASYEDIEYDEACAAKVLAAKDAIKEALAQPEQEPSATRPCRSCGGTGERFTGINEAPTSICKPCNGTGEIVLAQPEPPILREW